MSISKKLIAGAVAAVLASFTGVASANGGTYQEHASHSVYVGVAVSRDFARFRVNSDKYDTDADFSHDSRSLYSQSTFDFGGSGWNGDIFAGIGWVFQNHYYLGGEIFGSFSNTDARSDSTRYAFDGTTVLDTSNYRFQLRNSYGISLIPGVKISDSTMLYGRIGAVRSQFRLRASYNFYDTFVLSSGPATPVASFERSNNQSETALQLGVGLATMITQNVSASLEYDWSRYGTIRNTLNVPTVVVNGKASAGKGLLPLYFSNELSTRPTINQVKLAIAYHFTGA